MRIRAQRYCSEPASLRGEKTIIKQHLLTNGFPVRETVKWLNPPPTVKPQPDTNQRVMIPYSGSISAKLTSHLRKHSLNPVLTKPKSTQSYLYYKSTGESDKMDKSNVVYDIECACGGHYIGKTTRQLKVRVKEHEADATRNNKNIDSLSGLSRHLRVNPSHAIVNISIIGQKYNNRELELLEALEIELRSPSLNDKFGKIWSDAWNRLFKSMKHYN
jgi:hypothetical protein